MIVSSSERPSISVVVIGLNEEANLATCMQSIKDSNYPKEKIELIYVDSGSKDKSIEIARKFTNKIFVEEIWPTAARNRNRGLIESTHNIIHFIDGDIIIDKDYLETAVEKLLAGEVQVVFGRLEDKNVKGLSKILLHDYSNRKPGLIDSPGAGGTYLKKTLIEVNGWDERIPRGEEMEIGERLRKAGYKIWFLGEKMGIHDYGMTNIYQFLKRQVKEGMSVGQIMTIREEGLFFNLTKRSLQSNMISHVLMVGIIIISIVTKYYILLPVLLLVYIFFLFYKYRIRRKITNQDTLKYFFLTNLARSFPLYGYYRFLLKYLLLPAKDKNSLKLRINIRAELNKMQTI